MAQNNAQQIETMEHVPGAEHAAGFPPFQKDTFVSQLFWLAVLFLALYWIMSRIALPRVGSILEERRNRMDGDIADANRMKAESDEAIATYEKALAEARNKAHTFANEAREQHAAAAEAARKDLDASLNTKIAEAERAIAVRKTAAMASVQGIAAEAASAVVERLIGVTPAGHDVDSAVADALRS
jgi:F-type H+-transporting ATPase subunit b